MTKKKRSLDSSEEYYWKRFQDYNKIKYFFLLLIGFLFGISFISIIFLMVM